MKIHEDHNGVVTLTTVGNNGQPGHDYMILFRDKDGVDRSTQLHFQSGPVRHVGCNGITNESLLAVLINRLEHLNSVIASEHNGVALDALNIALNALESRTKDRLARNVEGTEGA